MQHRVIDHDADGNLAVWLYQSADDPQPQAVLFERDCRDDHVWTTIEVTYGASSVAVTDTRKPAQAYATATATVEAVNATWGQIVDAGLAAVGETRASVYGYSLLGEPLTDRRMTGTYTVRADRD